MRLRPGRVDSGVGEAGREPVLKVLQLSCDPSVRIDATDESGALASRSRSRSPGGALVSVVIPVYNGAAFVRETIDAVLAQDYAEIEIIAVDDGSADTSRAVLDSYGEKVTVIRQANGGSARARNAGFARSRGEFVLFLDHDDVPPAHKVSRQVELLQRHPEDEIVISDGREIEGDAIVDAHLVHPEIVSRMTTGEEDGVHLELYQGLLGQQPFKTLSQCLIRRRTFERVGAFNEDPRVAADHEWFLRHAGNGGAVRFHADALLRKRSHDASDSGPQARRAVRYAGLLLHSLVAYRPSRATRQSSGVESAIRRTAWKLAWLCLVHAMGSPGPERSFALGTLTAARERLPDHAGLRWAEAWLNRGDNSPVTGGLLRAALKWKRRFMGVRSVVR